MSRGNGPSPSGRILALEGPSAAGKTTVARAASRQFGWVRIGEAFDRLGRPDLAARTEAELRRIERTLLREDARRFAEARRSRDRGRTVVADTGFLGPLTYTAGLVARDLASPAVLDELEALARRLGTDPAWGLPDVVVYLAVPDRERRRRAVGDRRRHPTALDHRHAAVARFERAFYRDLRARLPSGTVRFVRAGGSHREVVRALSRIARAPLPDRAGPRPSLELFLACLRDRLRADEPAKRRGRHR